MKRLGLFHLLCLVTLLGLALPSTAYADGIIIPDPPICRPGPCPHPIPIAQLAIEYHRVDVTIKDQVAVTHVDQVFRNDNDWEVEGTYVFPLPLDAAVTSFTLWVDGEPVEGKVLTREEARRTYEEIVRSMRDPALLEYMDRGAVQASIYPIPPGGTRRIELEYTQVLEADGGLLHYVYPLNTEKFSTEPLEHVSVTISLDSQQPIRAVYSPSHKVAISREGPNHVKIGYEDAGVTPDRDFELYYSISTAHIGLNLLTYRDPLAEDNDGYFLLLATPKIESEAGEAIAKDVLLVLDQSGSMDGEKFRQAQQALRYVLDHLNAKDRFNVIAFSTGLRSYAGGLRPASEVDEAKRWVSSLAAQGATDINRALLEAVEQADSERPTILVFLTDGLPTEGVTDTKDILTNVGRAARSNIRLFAFGVGYDVDTYLLDTLAKEHHGATTYVTPDQSIDEAISGFYAKVSNPVLTDVELDFGDIIVSDLHPSPLPDLFAGGQLVLVGRYHVTGMETITISGIIDGQRRNYEYPERIFRSSGGPDFLPRLWATRKIGALLNQIRLEGPQEELVDQIVKLSIRYGIVTPYTSYLVTEPTPLGAAAQDNILSDAFEKLMSTPAMVSGQEAVERAAAEAEIGQADVALAPSGDAAEVVRVVGSRTFRLLDSVWYDTGFDPDSMTTLKVPFLSDDYFALADARPDLAEAFALGQRVIAIADGQAYEVVGTDELGDTITVPPPPESDPADEPPGLGDSGWVPPNPSPEGQDQPGFSLPCPGIGLVGAMTLLPLARVLKRD